MTRFEGGKKGPVVMFHGVGVSSGIFSLDTIETNLVEFLVEHRYHNAVIIFLVIVIIFSMITCVIEYKAKSLG